MPRWGEKGTGPNPTDRGKSGSKRSLLLDGNGIPLATVVDGANRHDMKLQEATLFAQRIVPSDLKPETHRHLCLEALLAVRDRLRVVHC